MSQTRSHRLTIIALVAQIVICIVVGLAIAVSAIMAGLRSPGVEDIGGISLVYDIKTTDSKQLTGHLATDVAEALKRRVDPHRVKNVIWRPQGDSRLEILIPLPPDAARIADARQKLREKLDAAADAIGHVNVDANAVIDAIENKNGRTQADLPQLAGNSQTRQKLFADLADEWSGIQKAHDARDARAEAQLKIEFEQRLHPKTSTGEKAPSPIEETNLAREQLDDALATISAPMLHATDAQQMRLNAAAQDQEIAAIRQRFVDFPSALTAIDNYVDAWRKLDRGKYAPGDLTDIKRLLKGAGVLEFHILAAAEMPPAERAKYVEKLHADGPKFRAGDEARWFEVARNQVVVPNENYRNKHYVLGYTTPAPDGKPRSLDQHAEKPWHLSDARMGTEMTGERIINFSFDPQGAVYFGDLTGSNIGKPLAIVLDNKVLSAPNINSKISSAGMIDGGSKGFSDDEANYLASTMRVGSVPAELSDEPISEQIVTPQPAGDFSISRHWRVAALAGVAVWLAIAITMLVSSMRERSRVLSRE